MGAGAPPPPPSDMGAETPPPPPTEDEGDMPPPPPEEGEEDMGMNQGEMDTEGEDEVVTFKSIQKLVGRLGQKLRTIASDEENKMSSKDIKYVVNSILSALNLDELDEDDREQIINKFEGIEDEESMGAEEDMSTDETGMEGEESSVPPPPPPAEEMGEMTENDGHDDISMIADNLFKEHKVEQLLYKYFVKGDNEKRVQKTINEEKQRKITQKNKFIVSEIKRLSESVSQEVSARKLIQQYPKLRFVGKSNKNNLVFENSSLNQFKVTPNGKLI